MGYINETTGNVGEYNIESTNTTDNVVEKIKEYELSFEDSEYLKENADNFGIKNLFDKGYNYENSIYCSHRF